MISLERFSALLTSDKMFKCKNSPSRMDGVDGKEVKEVDKVTREDTEEKGKGIVYCKAIKC